MKYKAMRGGAYGCIPGFLSSALRDKLEPSNSYSITGFRVLKRLNTQTRVLRGGSWMANRNLMRAVNRLNDSPPHRFDIYGFRVLRVKNEN